MVMRKNKYIIARNLVNKLWEQFMVRVSYAQLYQKAVTRKNGNLFLDHIGFRTLNAHTGEQPEGIWSIRHIFECLGYKLVQDYHFPKKELKAVHMETEDADLPMIFISQLEVSNMPEWVQLHISEVTANTSYLISDSGIELLNKIKIDGELTEEASEILINELLRYFHRPWNPPFKETVVKVNEVTHYGAWVLLHGNAPSHFAVLVNQLNIAGWPDLGTICKALQNEGIPMKKEIEGLSDNKLLQSATKAVREEVTVRDNGRYEEIPWTYGYLELVQRGHTGVNPDEHIPKFIESQERHLYQMTVTLEN
jgi:hypothetical protein